ncbi:tetratricopeptide repeat protein [Nostoc sp.]|uniref:tetratricopeptide repeat protein n=1 Tax=Nostoc sp. TaxID=1180 RepID=UPI002FF778E6
MSLSFTFALSQQQTFELRCNYGSRRLDKTELAALIDLCEQNGDIPKAIALWEQSLEISEQIGDVKGKATTLNNMALVIAQQGDIPKAIALWKQVASTLAQTSAYGDLVTVLNNLGVTDESNGLVYLAQAIWLTLRIQATLALTIQLMCALYNTVPQGHELETVLVATATFFCNYRGEDYPQLEELKKLIPT